MRDPTWAAWFLRYDAYQRSLGRYGSASAWREWILRAIGHLRLSQLRAHHVEMLRDELDAAILEWRKSGGIRRRGARSISGTTAINIWHALRAAIRCARRSKNAELRLLSRDAPDPCDDVEPPGDSETRTARHKTFIYPVEARALYACERISRDWREVHAIAGYTYLRPGELLVLRWQEVDLDHRVLRVTRAWHYVDRIVKAPKTSGGIRDVPIPRQLMPLLTRMRRNATSELVVPIMQTRVHETLAWRLRAHLWTAGVRRDALHTDTLTTVRANFRSWRDSGITWLAMSGLDATRIMRRAGHVDYATTLGYVKRAEDLTGEMGKPFGPLPAELIRRGSSS